MTLQYRIFVACIRVMDLLMQGLLCLVLFISINQILFPMEKVTLLASIILLAIPVVFLYIARRFIFNGFLLFIIHLLLYVVLVYIGNRANVVWSYSIVSAGLMIASIAFRTKNNLFETMPIGAVAVFIIAMIAEHYVESSLMAKVSLYAGLAFIFIQILHYNFSNVADFILMNRERTSLPISQIIGVNSLIMTILIFICGATAYLFGQRIIYIMVQQLGRWLKTAISIILRLLLPKATMPDVESIPEDIPIKNDLEMLPEIGETSIWAEILNKIAFILGCILCILVIVFLLVKLAMLFMNLFKKMNVTTKEQDVKEFIFAKDIRERSIRRRTKSDLDKKLNKKARSIYKAMVTRNASKKHNIINASMTPTEISNLYINQERETVTSIYEKARYGNDEVTKEEITILKSIGKMKGSS